MPPATKPRIAIVFEYPTLNGGERSMLAIIDAAETADFDFTIIAPDSGRLADAVRRRGLDLVPLRLRDNQGIRLPREAASDALRTAIEHCNPDLVHANSLAMGRLTGSIAADIHPPCLTHLRDILRLSKAAIADLNQNKKLIAVSTATRDFHCQQGLSQSRTQVLYNGIDTEKFRPQQKTGRLIQELNLPPDAQLIATIGQVGMRKGQDVLAAAAIQNATACPHVHYLLIGERNSTKQENIDFEQALFDQFPAGKMHRLGYRHDVAQLLSEIDLLVHPARQEPFGRVLLEAAAAGVPIIATAVGGTAEMLTDSQSALLIPPNNSPALSTAIKNLLANQQQRIQLGQNARQRILSQFSIHAAATHLANIWQHVLKNAAN